MCGPVLGPRHRSYRDRVSDRRKYFFFVGCRRSTSGMAAFERAFWATTSEQKLQWLAQNSAGCPVLAAHDLWAIAQSGVHEQAVQLPAGQVVMGSRLFRWWVLLRTPG